MKFKIQRRIGDFGKLNIRTERHGDEPVLAADYSITFPSNKRELDMLCPTSEDAAKFSDAMYDDKGNLVAGYLSPIANRRKPENVLFTIWDSPTKKTQHMKFDGCNVKSISIALNDKRNMECSLTVQMHHNPEEHASRLERLSAQKAEFELEAQQEDFSYAAGKAPEEAQADFIDPKPSKKTRSVKADEGDDDE